MKYKYVYIVATNQPTMPPVEDGYYVAVDVSNASGATPFKNVAEAMAKQLVQVMKDNK